MANADGGSGGDCATNGVGECLATSSHYQNKMAIFTASVLTTLLATARVPADEVTRLPGWKGKLPSEHFSGYLNVGNLSKVPG